MFHFLKKKDSKHMLGAPAAGRAVSIKEVNDPTFAEEILGKGVAVIPSEGKIYAPADGEIGMVFDTLHAVSLTTEYGAEVLIHVGLDTVDMKGKGFQLHVSLGEKVEKGAPLITFSPEEIKKAGHMALTILAVTDEAGVKKIHFHTGIHATAGETVIADFE